MKRILTAILVIAFTCSTFFAQTEYPSDRLLESPLKQFKRERIDKLNREAQEKSKILENSPLANRATGFSLFFRLIGEHPTFERLESDKYRLEIIGIENVSEQNLIIEKAEEFVQMSNGNKFAAEQTIVKKHHTDGDKHHTDFTEEDFKAAQKLQDAKAKDLRKIIKTLEQRLSRASFAAIESYVQNGINPSTKFHLTPKGEIEVERLKRDSKKSVSVETWDCENYEECYPSNPGTYNGYVYSDTLVRTKGSRQEEIESQDGLIIDPWFDFNSESVYEVDPISNSHGINFISEVRSFENGASVSFLSTSFSWTMNVGGQTLSYSLENFVSTDTGGFDKRISYDIWCGVSYSYTAYQNYYFGTSNLAYYWSFRGSDGVDIFTHDTHDDNGWYCPTHCGDWTTWRNRQARILWKNRTPAPGELESTRLMIFIPWGSRSLLFKPEQQENTFNDWCSAFGAGAGAKFMGFSVIPFDECFDTSVNIGSIWQ